MTSANYVDSRLYRHAFLITSVGDVPEDFRPTTPMDFRAGLFLPGPERGSTSSHFWAAMVLSLLPGRLFFEWHPATRRRPVILPLVELPYLESARFLLSGWLRLVAADIEVLLPYAVRNSPWVDDFLRLLRGEWLTARASRRGETTHIGARPERKFLSAEESECDTDERILVRFYHAGAIEIKKSGLRSCRVKSAADLVGCTDRRVFWITERCAGRREPYGTANIYGPARCCARRVGRPRSAGMPPGSSVQSKPPVGHPSLLWRSLQRGAAFCRTSCRDLLWNWPSG